MVAGGAAGLLLIRSARVAGGANQEALSLVASLVLRAQAGDERAFDELMAATEERILAVAWRLLGSREEARDAAQETFLRAYRYISRFRPEHDFEAWLYRIAVNVCRDFRRRGRLSSATTASLDAEREAGRLAEPACGPEAETRVLDGERRSLVLRALATLPERERAALVLRDLEGKTSEDVARILGSRPGTVRAQLASARARLKRALVHLAAPRAAR